MTDKTQNELIRLLPEKETEQDHAIEVAKVGDVYFIHSVHIDGQVISSVACSNLSEVFATIADLLAARPGAEYFIER